LVVILGKLKLLDSYSDLVRVLCEDELLVTIKTVFTRAEENDGNKEESSDFENDGCFQSNHFILRLWIGI